MNPKQTLIEVKYDLLDALGHLTDVHNMAQSLPVGKGPDRSEIVRTVQEARRWTEAAVSATIDAQEAS